MRLAAMGQIANNQYNRLYGNTLNWGMDKPRTGT